MTTSKPTTTSFDNAQYRDAAADVATDVPLDARDDVAVAVDDRERRADVPWMMASDICVLTLPASRQAASPPKSDLDEPEASRTTAGAAETLPTFATVDEVADLLRLERKAVYRLAAAGELPGCRRLGRSFRVHLPTVISWFGSSPRADRKRGKK